MFKKSFLLLPLVVATIFVACDDEYESNGLDGEYLVYTEHGNTDFSTFKTFYIPDSILIMGEKKDEPTYWNNSDSRKIVDLYVSELESRGFERTEDKQNADMGIQVSYIYSTRYFAGYDYSYWWGGYPGYWSPYYWGGWGGWWYGYPIYYSYSDNSLLTEILDLTAPDGEDSKLPVIWNSYINGESTGYNRIDMGRMLRAVSQSISQSPYINNTKNQ